MAMLWRDVERDLASSQRHFALAVDLFDEVRDGMASRDQYVRSMGFLHAMQSGYTSFEAGMKRLLALLDEPLPAGAEWHKALLRRLEEAAPGAPPARGAEPARPPPRRGRRGKGPGIRTERLRPGRSRKQTQQGASEGTWHAR